MTMADLNVCACGDPTCQFLQVVICEGHSDRCAVAWLEDEEGTDTRLCVPCREAAAAVTA